MQLQLIRHATLVLDWGDVQLMVDPMLSPKDTLDPVGNAASQQRIPMVELPVSYGEMQRRIDALDGVLVTHMHRDHWDARAAEMIDSATPLLCQPPDLQKLEEAGYTNVLAIEDSIRWYGIEITRTGGRHGSGEMAERMGPVSGFVFHAHGAPTVYLAGDTVWCDEVAVALDTHRPDVTIVNAGAAQFLSGGSITMSSEDIARVCDAVPDMRVIAVHMDTINHCLLTRDRLDAELRKLGLRERVTIPADGEVLELPVSGR